MLTRHRTHWYKQGDVFLTYVAWYAFGRFFTEGMRTDSLMLFNVIRVSQALSVVLFFGSIGLMIWRRHHNPNNRWYLAGSGQKVVAENK